MLKALFLHEVIQIALALEFFKETALIELGVQLGHASRPWHFKFDFFDGLGNVKNQARLVIAIDIVFILDRHGLETIELFGKCDFGSVLEFLLELFTHANGNGRTDFGQVVLLIAYLFQKILRTQTFIARQCELDTDVAVQACVGDTRNFVGFGALGPPKVRTDRVECADKERHDAQSY